MEALPAGRQPGCPSQVLRSLHSPWFSGQTPGGLCRTRPIQNSEFLALEWLELSGDSPVIVRCMLVGLLSPMDFSGGQSTGISPNQQAFPPEITGQQQKVRWSPVEGPTDSSGKSNGVQRTTSRPAYLLLLLLKNEI